MTLLALLALFPAVSLAGPNECGTPAQETVCDPLKGGTPGLYGLCVAYCEAQDCEPDAFLAGECTTGSKQVLAAYNAKRGRFDPFMPCVKVPCPCYDREDLEQLQAEHPDTLMLQGVFSDVVKGDLYFSITHGVLAGALEVTAPDPLYPYVCGSLQPNDEVLWQGLLAQQYETCVEVLLDFAKAANLFTACVPNGVCPQG